MANPRSRKRVFAHRRGPDGSAFHRCDFCGVSVAIALLDMHECCLKGSVKRLKGCGGGKRGTRVEPIVLDHDESDDIEKPHFEDQPRSAFCFFMERFRESYKAEEWMEADRKGFETWKSMSELEKGPFDLQAKLVDLAYEAALIEESVNSQKLKVDDEADSATVIDYYPHFEDWQDSE